MDGNLLTIDELFDFVDENSQTESKMKIACEKILEAANDWRIEIYSLNEFYSIIEKLLGKESTKENISKRLKAYELNAVGNLWELEAFTSLIEVFKYNETMTLKEIFEEISNKLKK